MTALSQKKRSRLAGTLVVLLCLIGLALFIPPMFLGIINPGNIAGVFVCAVLFAVWAFFPVIRQHKALYRLFLIGTALFAAGCCWAVYLSVNMLIAMRHKPELPPVPENPKTVIVLGCQVKNGFPTRMFAERLAAALDYLNADRTAVCVVTGGQGANESCSEAEAGAEWLIDKGVDAERLFLEDKSVSTAQNLTFALDVVRANGLPEDVIIVSDGFHLWRAERRAKKLFDSASVIACKTTPLTVPAYWVREWFALTVEMIGLT